MACAALTSLIQTIEIEFLQPPSRVRLSLHDRPLIISILENLYSFQDFLQNKSSGDGDGDGDALRDFEIKIRDFALKAEDDIETQLSNILLLSEYGEKAASHHHQTLQESAENAAESCSESEREMGSAAALNILIKKFQHYFLQHFPTVYVAMLSFLQKLSSLRGCLLWGYSNSNAGAAIKKMVTKIRIFALKADQDDMEEASSQELSKTLQEAAERAEELLMNIVNSTRRSNSNEEVDDDDEVNHETRPSTVEEAVERAEELLINSSRRSNEEVDDDEEEEEEEANRETQPPTVEAVERVEELLMNIINSSRRSNSNGEVDDDDDDDEVEEEEANRETQPPTVEAVERLEELFMNIINSSRRSNSNEEVDDDDDDEEEEEANRETQPPTVEEAVERLEEFFMNIINSSRRSNSNEEVDDDDEANHETQPSTVEEAMKNVVESDGSSSSSSSSSSNGFLKPEGRMVGRYRDCTVIKDQLFFSSFGPLKIISIIGMVGIGKTTLARNVYEDPSVASHFDVRAWVTIPDPQHYYNKSRMLRDLLQSIMPKKPNVSTLHEIELQIEVWKSLHCRKYLIVLDNIISSEAWTDIQDCVPDDNVGSCILLTTRHFNLSTYRGYVHHMTLLDPKESWKLFRNTLSIEEHLAPKFEKIRNHVVEKCDGLPQLIVEVAKRLSKCNNIQQGWKKIEKELESLGLLDRNTITAIYNPLPHHLKVCFLYFGVFPKRKRVRIKMLIRLWIAEGFVKPLKHNELEDQAYEYLLELIDRSFLLLENRSSDGKIKTCRMHSAMHSFCVVEAQKEGILCAVNTQQHSGLSLKAFANSCRWLSLYSHSFDYYVLFGTNIPRSVFFFLENPEMFVPPKLLRVLAFDTCISLQRVPMQLVGLVFLRYLSITQWFEDLNDVVSNNPNLGTLVVYGNGAPTVHLPSSIWKPSHLRHLTLGNSYIVDPPSADKKSLQTLSWVVRPVDCRKGVYNKFPNIKNLKILVKDDIEPPSHIGGCCSNPIILDHFDYFKWLEKLSISVSIGCNAALPELARFPSGLKKLKLSGTNISAGDLNVISKLPHLKVLKLENAFHGTVWEVDDGGFRELIFLLLEAKELEQWVLSSWYNFSALRHLVLRSCNCLEQMPTRFKGYGLETIELEGCHSSLVASVKQLIRNEYSQNLEIKILGTEYDDESQSVSAEEDLASQPHTLRVN